MFFRFLKFKMCCLSVLCDCKPNKLWPSEILWCNFTFLGFFTIFLHFSLNYLSAGCRGLIIKNYGLKRLNSIESVIQSLDFTNTMCMRSPVGNSGRSEDKMEEGHRGEQAAESGWLWGDCVAGFGELIHWLSCCQY